MFLFLCVEGVVEMLTVALVTARWKQTALQCNLLLVTSTGKSKQRKEMCKSYAKVMFLVAVFRVATWRASVPLLKGGCHTFFWSQMSCLLLDKVFINQRPLLALHLIVLSLFFKSVIPIKGLLIV